MLCALVDVCVCVCFEHSKCMGALIVDSLVYTYMPCLYVCTSNLGYSVGFEQVQCVESSLYY